MDDYDSARVFLAKWAAGLADQSEKSGPFDQRYRHVGIWGHDDWEEETALGVFEVLNVNNYKIEYTSLYMPILTSCLYVNSLTAITRFQLTLVPSQCH